MSSKKIFLTPFRFFKNFNASSIPQSTQIFEGFCQHCIVLHTLRSCIMFYSNSQLLNSPGHSASSHRSGPLSSWELHSTAVLTFIKYPVFSSHVYPVTKYVIFGILVISRISLFFLRLQYHLVFT